MCLSTYIRTIQRCTHIHIPPLSTQLSLTFALVKYLSLPSAESVPSFWMLCSHEYCSHTAFPSWIPAWPTEIEITSRVGIVFSFGFQVLMTSKSQQESKF